MRGVLALSMPTVATGTPGGICAIESSASRPPAALRWLVSGTPITGRSVWAAASDAGSAAESPAAAMITRRPRPTRALAVLRHLGGIQVRAHHAHLHRYARLLEDILRDADDGQIGVVADDDADERPDLGLTTSAVATCASGVDPDAPGWSKSRDRGPNRARGFGVSRSSGGAGGGERDVAAELSTIEGDRLRSSIRLRSCRAESVAQSGDGPAPGRRS